MESCVGCGQMLPLLAIAVYKEPAVPASAVGVRLLLSICVDTTVLGCIYNVWVTVDTLWASVVEPDGS